MKLRFIYLLMIGLLAGFTSTAQESSIDKFVKDKEASSFFLYQSTLRSFNVDSENDDFNKLIRNLEVMRVFIIQNEVEKSDFKSLIKKIKKKNYESIMEVDSKDFTVRLFAKDKGSKSTYVLGVFSEKGLFLADMKGSLDMEYLSAVKDEKLLKNIGSVIPSNIKIN